MVPNNTEKYDTAVISRDRTGIFVVFENRGKSGGLRINLQPHDWSNIRGFMRAGGKVSITEIPGERDACVPISGNKWDWQAVTEYFPLRAFDIKKEIVNGSCDISMLLESAFAKSFNDFGRFSLEDAKYVSVVAARDGEDFDVYEYEGGKILLTYKNGDVNVDGAADGFLIP